MKKIIYFLFIFFFPLIVVGQEEKPSTSLGDLPIEIKAFVANIEIENQTLIKDLILKESPAYKETYLRANMGTLKGKIEFSPIVKRSLGQFIFVSRVVKIGEAYELASQRKGTGELVRAPLMSDVRTKKILVQAVFTNPFNGEEVKKLLEINFDQNAEPSGDEVLAKATITNKDLGLNVLTLNVESPVGFTFSLQNKAYGVNMVVGPNDKGTLEFLAPGLLPDGVHTFVCRLGLPNGISAEEKVEAFVSGGKVILEKSSFNPLAFAEGGKASFSGKRTLVKLHNARSEDVVVFVPEEYFAQGVQRPLGADLQTEAFEGVAWKSYVIASGKSIKVRMRTSSSKAIVYGYRSKETQILELGLQDRNNQTKTLSYGGWRSR